jgi:hypothetical protein
LGRQDASQLRANNGLVTALIRSRRPARASNDAGTLMPSALPAFKLMTSSNRVGNSMVDRVAMFL